MCAKKHRRVWFSYDVSTTFINWLIRFRRTTFINWLIRFRRNVILKKWLISKLLVKPSALWSWWATVALEKAHYCNDLCIGIFNRWVNFSFDLFWYVCWKIQSINFLAHKNHKSASTGFYKIVLRTLKNDINKSPCVMPIQSKFGQKNLPIKVHFL